MQSIDDIQADRIKRDRAVVESLIAYNVTVTHEGETLRLPPTPVERLDHYVAEAIRDLSDDGFNVHGSGPVPIKRRGELGHE